MKFDIEIHPIMVHFPIAFYFLELLLIVLWIKSEHPHYLDFARFVFKLGFFFMFLAAAAGLFDVGGFSHIKGRVRTHFLAALSVIVLYTIRALFWRFGKPNNSTYRWTHLLFAGAGNILIAVAGYFGGLLVYGT